MTPERWQQVKDICYAVLDSPPEARPALLHTLCRGDADLQRDVEVMMADVGKSTSALDRPAWEWLGIPAGTLPAPRRVAAGTAWTPDTIASYRILNVIGEGGMGVVYEAQQEEPRRIVALKVIRPGFASAEMLRRFRQESEALARLQHPGIAQIHAAGTADTPLGPQPYFAMELIRGEPLTVYADRQQMSVAQRLDLVARICDAVNHAHQRGLIHRDLKPANILVDDTGQPKILDFGVARLTDIDVQRSQHTDIGELIGTLAYMSPEQVLADPLELDTRSDVYALGVILFELLAGRLPYALSARLPEAIRTIQQEDPQRLSSISRVFRGDLETIAAKALEKDKTRRYGSASALAADIRRYLHNEPISARPSSATYQLGKFARRHKAFVGGLCAVFVVLIGGIAASTWQAIRANQERDRAVRERERADSEADRATAAIDFLTTTLGAVDPRIAQGDEPTVRQLLDEAERRLSQDELPSSDASAIRMVLAESRFQLGQFARARDLYEKQFLQSRDNVGVQHPQTLTALAGFAAAQAELGQLKDAEANARLAVDSATATGTRAVQTSIRAMNTLAGILLQLGTRRHAVEAERIVDRARALGQSVRAPNDEDRLRTDRLTAEVRIAQNRLLEAEPLARNGYRAALAAFGPRHPVTLAALDTLTTCLFGLSRYSELLEIQQGHADETRRVLGKDHIMTLWADHAVADTLRALDRVAEARQAFDRVLAAKTRVLGETHPSTLTTRHSIALLYKDMQDPGRAQQSLQEVARIRRSVLGPQHDDTLASEMMIALTLFQQGRLEESRDAYAEVLPRIKTSLGESSNGYLVGTANYAGLLYRLGDYTGAEQTLRESVAAHQRAFGDHHVGTYYTMTELGTTLVHLNRHAEAEGLLLAAWNGYRDIYSHEPNHRRIQMGLDRLFKLYTAWGKPERANHYRGLLDQVSKAAK
jgi:serine/threonine protein kinase